MAKGWSDEEVARRWGLLYPPRNSKREILPISSEWLEQKLANPEWIAKRREWLGSLSWYMKALKEPLARLANFEDDCDGHFFAARFKSIALLDVIALLEVCVYIDLNPLAAGIASLPEKSPYTSLTQRVAHVWPKLSRADLEAALRGLVGEQWSSGEAEQTHWLCPLEDRRQHGAAREGMLEGFSLPKYLLLVDHTARLFREGKGHLDSAVAPIFERLGTTAEMWQHQLVQLKAKFSCRKVSGRVMAATKDLLTATAQRLGLHHLVNLTGLQAPPAPPSG